MKTLVISLGGSIVVPEEIDIDFLKKFRDLAINFINKGNKLAIIVGGGRTCRKYQNAAREFTNNNQELDWIGIYSTWLNARLIKSIFGELSKQEVIRDYENINFNDDKIIIGGGGVPGQSTDTDAVVLASKIGADAIINLTDQYYVFTADPRKYNTAKPLSNLTGDEYLKIIGEEWSPGRSTPFDPIASKLAKENKIKVIITKGSDLDNLKSILEGKDFRGTTII